MKRSLWLLVLCACPSKEPPPPPGPARCELDVMARGDLFELDGSGARAVEIASDADRIGGQFAASRNGDFLLENDRIRVVIGAPGRDLMHVPYGGYPVDADLKRGAGEPGRDQLGKLGLIYSFGRAIDVSKVEVLRDGSAGGPAVIAATGLDALNDVTSVQAAIDRDGIGLKLAIDPDVPQPLRATHYYVLSGGSDRLRMVTALCDDGEQPVATTVGDVSAGGGTMSLYNPDQCSGGLGQADCLGDPTHWFGWSGDGVAYGYRAYRVDDPSVPDVGGAIYLSGSIASIAGMKDLSGLLTWLDSTAATRPGRVLVRPGTPVLFVRDLTVGASLADVASTWLRLDGAAASELVVTTSPGASVAAVSSSRLVSLARAGSDGKAKLMLKAGTYTLSVGLEGHAIATASQVLGPEERRELTLLPPAARTLSVSVKDPFGKPLPAKVLVRCPGGPCAEPRSRWALFSEVEATADDIAAMAYVPPSGTLALELPPAIYEVIVTHGPEFSAWPDTVPMGARLDLTAADAAVDAVLARVVDTSGWLSADLHVHGVNSADASAANEKRVLAFAAEGVDVLVATDHDFVTDYAPAITAVGAGELMSSVIGDEISPIFGHHNAFPLVRDGTFSGGPIDWAGGAAQPTLRPGQFYALAHERGALVQVNHPRSQGGVFDSIKLDTLTGKTHADPAVWRVAPAGDATADDTKLFSAEFDLLEIHNGLSPQVATVNDWMVFLSRGLVRTATAVSDTHTVFNSPSGYGRTYVKLDTFTESGFIAALKAGRAVGGNGPFLSASAQKMGSTAVAGVGDTLQAMPGEHVLVSVTVQAPEWMQFDRVELYTHAAGREASDGKHNSTWPAALQTQPLMPGALPVEPVVVNGQTFRRVKVEHTFDVTVTADAWLVVMVRAGSASRDLQPLAFRGSCDQGVCTSSSPKAFAYSNPIFIDADGSGAYDVFPLAR